MIAVIIKNTLGKYTKEEFEYAVNLFNKTGKVPKVVVYTLPTNDDNEARFEFLKTLRSGESDYFHCKVDNEDQLIDKIKGELLFIKNEYEAEEKSSVASAEETVIRLKPDSTLTQEAIELFKKGDYTGAIKTLDMNRIREHATKLSAAQKEVAQAFILKAKLELTDVKNKERFIIAEKLFNEALNASRDPEILFEYAYHCCEQKIFIKAIMLYDETLLLYRKLAADSPTVYNPAVAMILNNLAILHSNNNNYTQAEAKYSEALEIRRKLAADNPAAYNPDVATTLNNLANLHRVNNDYTQAEAEFSEALEIRRKLAADNPAAYNPNVATTLNNLALLHSDNNYKQAEAKYNEALEIRRKLALDSPAAYNPDVAMTLNNLANLHRVNNDYTQAEAKYNEALEIRRKLAADNPAAYNPDVATILNNLAILHSGNNDYTQAEAEFSEALEIRRKLAADNQATYNPAVAMTLNNLAILHRANNDYTQAEAKYSEALEICRRLAADSPAVYNPAAYNPTVATTPNILANFHKANNDYTQAEAEYSEALEIHRKLATDNPAVYNPDVAMTLNNLANLHRVNNDYTQAEAEYNEALDLITPFYQKYPQVFQKRYDLIKQSLKLLIDKENSDK